MQVFFKILHHPTQARDVKVRRTWRDGINTHMRKWKGKEELAMQWNNNTEKKNILLYFRFYLELKRNAYNEIITT